MATVQSYTSYTYVSSSIMLTRGLAYSTSMIAAIRRCLDLNRNWEAEISIFILWRICRSSDGGAQPDKCTFLNSQQPHQFPTIAFSQDGFGRPASRLSYADECGHIGGRSRIRTLVTFCTSEKDSLARASEKCALIIALFYYSEKLGYFH